MQPGSVPPISPSPGPGLPEEGKRKKGKKTQKKRKGKRGAGMSSAIVPFPLPSAAEKKGGEEKNEGRKRNQNFRSE